MPLSIDGSSLVSESRKASVFSRDGGLCVLCGMDPTDVAHIVARKAGDQNRVEWIRQVAPTLSNFRKDDPLNLICLCPTHHRQYDSGKFVLVPSKEQRESLLHYEHLDFDMREKTLASGGGDPGRTFPQILDEFEYIPIKAGPFRIHIHNPTPYDNSIFVFDNQEYRPSPLLHFRASHIALMVEAEPHLSTVTRVQSLKGDEAEPQISALLRLYRREPAGRSSTSPAIFVPSDYNSLCAMLEQPNSNPSARILTTVPSSPPPTTDPPPFTPLAFGPIPDLTPSSSTSTDITSQLDDADLNRSAKPDSDIQLMEYMKEASVSWEELNNRPPLFGGEEVGLWRFASTDDVCHSKGF